MALHDATDPQVAALRALLEGGLNAELEATTTEPVVRATYGYPAIVPNGRVPQLALPALAVYRVGDRGEVRRTSRHTETLATFRFDYCTPATPIDLIDQRWPLLRVVWEKLVELIAAGRHASVSGGACVLRDAGFVKLERNAQSPSVRYIPPSADEAGYLRFEGTVQLAHRPGIDISDLPWFTELFASYDLIHATSGPGTILTLPTRSLIGHWEFRDAALDSAGHIIALQDRSGNGNHLAIDGVGDDVFVEVDADYGNQRVGVFYGGKYLTRAAFTQGSMAQPNTLLFLGEISASDGAAYGPGGGGEHVFGRFGGAGIIAAGAPVSVGDLAIDAPVAALTVFDGASTSHRHGDDWSVFATVDPGTDPLDGITIGAGEGGALPLTGRVAMIAAYADRLTEDEARQAAGYLFQEFLRPITPRASRPGTVTAIVEDLARMTAHGSGFGPGFGAP